MSSCRCCESRDVFGRCDLGAQRGLGDGRGDHVGGEAQIARLEGEALVVGLGVQRLDLAADAAERIERIRHVDAGAVQRVVIRAAARQAECGQRDVLCALRFVGAGHAGVQGAALRGDVLVRLPQGRLRGLERRAVGERALDQRIQLGGSKQGPPLARNIQAVDEALRFAAGQRRGCGDRGQADPRARRPRRRAPSGGLKFGPTAQPATAPMRAPARAQLTRPLMRQALLARRAGCAARLRS